VSSRTALRLIAYCYTQYLLCDGDNVVRLVNRTIGDLVAKNQSISSRLQYSLDRLAGIDAENQSLKATLMTSVSTSAKPVNVEARCCQHRGNVTSRAQPCLLVVASNVATENEIPYVKIRVFHTNNKR